MQNGIKAVLDFGAQGRYELAEPGPGGSSRSKAWTARVEINGLEVGLRSVNEVIRSDSDDDGLPFHALSELAILKDLASCQLQPCPFVQASAVLVQSGRMYVAYSRHFAHDLQALLKIKEEPGSLSIVEARSYCVQMFAGIQYMHSLGILHRNLKPEHILFDQQGFLAISGFASACREHLGQSPRATYKLTISPFFATPERLLGELHCDTSADIWAAGLIVAFMGKQGHQPFHGVSGVQMWHSLWYSNGPQSCEIELIFDIFERLGTPQSPHPLTRLPFFSQNFPQWSNKGWEDTKPILGAEGADFLAGLTNLDPRLRPSAEAALLHTFLKDRPGSYDGKLPANAVADEASAEVTSSLQTAAQLYLGLELQLERTTEIRHRTLANLSTHCEKSRYLSMDRYHLVSWMTAVAAAMKFEPQVLHLSVRLLDHTVMNDGVKLYFIGYRPEALAVAAVLVAVKMERQELAGERWLFHVANFDSVIKEQALKFEAEMISSPAMVSGWGTYQFLCSFAEQMPFIKVNFESAHYFLDRSLLAFDLLRHTPSLLAAAACLSISTDQQDALSSLAACCGRSEEKVASVADEAMLSIW